MQNLKVPFLYVQSAKINLIHIIVYLVWSPNVGIRFVKNVSTIKYKLNQTVKYSSAPIVNVKPSSVKEQHKTYQKTSVLYLINMIKGMLDIAKHLKKK